MNIFFGIAAILVSLGCLLLYFVRSPDPGINMWSPYPYYSLVGAIIFFAAGIFSFYRHWRFETGEDDGEEMV
jgi:hypothetical protein